MSTRRDKTTGLPLPTPVVPPTNLCVQMIIPNDPLYVQAFRGVLADLGKYWTWSRTVGESDEPAQTAAEMWRDRLQFITITEDCEEPVSCADVANCITTNGAVRDAIRAFVLGDTAINNMITNNISTTVLPVENREQNLLKPDACEYGFIFNQVSTLVSLLNSVSTDIFQSIEVETNGLERAEKLVAAIPVIGGLFPFDEIIAGAEQLVEEAFENYEADWDEDLYDTIRCAMFCLFKDECEINITQAIEFYEGLFVEALPSDPVELFVAILQFIMTGLYPANTVVYAMHILCLSAIQLSQTVLGVDFATMGLRIMAAGDEADNDWEILCEDCSPTPPTGLWAILPGYAGLTEAQSGQITAQTPTSVTFSTDQSRDGEYRIVAVYDNFGAPVTIVTSSNPGSILAKYSGVGSSMFGGTVINRQLVPGDTLNYLYFTDFSPFTLTLTFTT